MEGKKPLDFGSKMFDICQHHHKIFSTVKSGKFRQLFSPFIVKFSQPLHQLPGWEGEHLGVLLKDGGANGSGPLPYRKFSFPRENMRTQIYCENFLELGWTHHRSSPNLCVQVVLQEDRTRPPETAHQDLLGQQETRTNSPIATDLLFLGEFFTNFAQVNTYS